MIYVIVNENFLIMTLTKLDKMHMLIIHMLIIRKSINILA